MTRNVTITTPAGDWTGYMIEAHMPDGSFLPVAGRDRPKKGWPASFGTSAVFPSQAVGYRVTWVGVGGSRNMLPGEPCEFGAAPAARATYGGAT